MLEDHHKKRVVVDAARAIGKPEDEKELAKYSPEQVSEQFIKYINECAIEAFFCVGAEKETANLILDLNDDCDIWLNEFAEVRSELIDYADPDHHLHSYYNNISLDYKSCSDKPRRIEDIDRWPFLDDVLADFDALIQRAVDYLSPESSSSLDHLHDHREFYAERADTVRMLGRMRAQRDPYFGSLDDREALSVGLIEIIRAATYVGDCSHRPTGVDSRKEILFGRATDTLFSEMERLLHSL